MTTWAGTAFLGLVLSGCPDQGSENRPNQETRQLSLEDSSPSRPNSMSPSPLSFVEVRESGVDFSYRNGEEAGALAILESLGGGVAIFDYDHDGWPDLFFPGGGRIVPGPSGWLVEGRAGRLYRNEGRWRFRDVTESAGLADDRHYTHGCSVGDVDNDGDDDLLITSYHGVVLYRNDRGHFVDITEAAGLSKPGWASSASWIDFDGDGWLDLYVARYVDWSPENHPECRYQSSGEVDICAPGIFEGLTDSLYRNRGDGTFEEVGRKAGILEGGKGLGVVAADLDGDGDTDLYVANDTTPNWLYRNQGDGTFEEVGLLSGAALSAEGIATGSMGVAVGDLDEDGDLDLWVTNYEGEINELYRNDGELRFVPIGMASGLGAASRPMVGWGTSLFDVDGDGTLEVFVTNGHLMHRLPGTPRPQPPMLFQRSPHERRFRAIDGAAGPYFSGKHQGRGCAVGDLDLDGLPDAVIVSQNAPVTLLRNETRGHGRFLSLRLEGMASNRSAIGATVTVQAAGRSYLRTIAGGGSYLSHDDRRLLIGLGERSVADRVEIRWPSGRTDTFERLEAGPRWLIREGEAPEAEPEPASGELPHPR